MSRRSDAKEAGAWIPAGNDTLPEQVTQNGGERRLESVPDDWVPKGLTKGPDSAPAQQAPGNVAAPEPPQVERPRTPAPVADHAERPRLADRNDLAETSLREAETRAREAERKERLATEAAHAAESRSRAALERGAGLEAELKRLTERLAAQEASLKRQQNRIAADERLRWSLVERAEGAEQRLHDLDGRLDRSEAAEPKAEAAEPKDEVIAEFEPEPEPEPELEPVPVAEPVAAPEPTSAEAEPDLLVNSASFEELRELGLSVNQAARVVAQRDQRGGFSSAQEVETLWGLPAEVVEQLKGATRA